MHFIEIVLQFNFLNIFIKSTILILFLNSFN